MKPFVAKATKKSLLAPIKEKIKKERRLPPRLYLKNWFCNFVVHIYNIICIEEKTLINYEPPLIPEREHKTQGCWTALCLQWIQEKLSHLASVVWPMLPIASISAFLEELKVVRAGTRNIPRGFAVALRGQFPSRKYWRGSILQGKGEGKSRNKISSNVRPKQYWRQQL